MEETNQEPVLGRPDSTPTTQIDTFSTEGPVELVHFRSSELTAVCPVTNQPDFYTIDISYSPESICIETKSLKLFLRTFEGVGIFAEHLAPRIANHLGEAVQVPVKVILEQQIRGGIITTVTSVSNN